MTDKEKLEAIRAKIERLLYAYNQEADIASAEDSIGEKVAAGKYDVCKHLLSLIDSIQKLPVSKVWHDVTTKAIEGRILWHSTYNDTWMVMFADQINWNVCDKWAYIDELLKL